MIYFFTGENSYAMQQEVAALKHAFDGEVEKYSGSDITKNTMADITQGMSLFASKKMVIIDTLSENKALWDELETWCERLNDETIIVLLEAKPDKRTKTYKYLQKAATVKEFTGFSYRETVKVEQWLLALAQEKGYTLDARAAKEMVVRLGYDQWMLANELERLAGFAPITFEVVTQYTPASETENVFVLLETALKGDKKKVNDMLRVLKATNDPYLTFGLLSSQVFALSALVLGDGKAVGDVAKDIGQKEYALSKLRPQASRISAAQLKAMIDALVATDKRMKSTDAPWQAIESFLLGL